MGLLELNPPPSAYYEDPVDVTITVPQNCVKAIITTDGTPPGIVSTVAASNKWNPPVPYLQTVQDGRGFLVLDGAFPRWYNTNWAGATSYSALSAEHKLMANIWLTILNGGTKLLILGDASTSESYPVLSTKATGFYTFFTKLAQALGISVTIKDRNSYGGYLNPSLSELLQADAVMVVGSSSETIPNTMITEEGAQNIATSRLQGKGLYLVGDHAPYFVNCVNRILKYVASQAELSGNYNFTPGTTVGYNKAAFGDSVLFANVPDTALVRADDSNSMVSQPATSWTPLPATFHIPKGFTTIKAVVQDCDGNISYEEYGYAIEERPIVLLEDDPTEVLEFRTEVVDTEYWDNQYHNLTREVNGEPPGTPIWEGGNWFPTTHVEIVANGGLSTISIETLSEFFYEIANYNLVLSSVDADYTMPVAPDQGTPATRVVAAAVAVDNVVVTSTEGRYGASPPTTVLTDGVPTNVYGAGTVILGKPSGWFEDPQGRKFPVYNRGLVESDGEELPTVLYDPPTVNPIGNSYLLGYPDEWTALPGNPRTGGKLPGWSASPPSTNNGVVPTKIFGSRDILLSNPRGFVEINNNFVPYW